MSTMTLNSTVSLSMHNSSVQQFDKNTFSLLEHRVLSTGVRWESESVIIVRERKKFRLTTTSNIKDKHFEIKRLNVLQSLSKYIESDDYELSHYTTN